MCRLASRNHLPCPRNMSSEKRWKDEAARRGWLNSFARPPSTTHQQSLFPAAGRRSAALTRGKHAPGKKQARLKPRAVFTCSSTHVKIKPRTHLVDDAVRALPNLLQLLVPLHGGAFPSALSPPRQGRAPTRRPAQLSLRTPTPTRFSGLVSCGGQRGDAGRGCMHPAKQDKRPCFGWKKCKKERVQACSVSSPLQPTMTPA